MLACRQRRSADTASRPRRPARIRECRTDGRGAPFIFNSRLLGISHGQRRCRVSRNLQRPASFQSHGPAGRAAPSLPALSASFGVDHTQRNRDRRIATRSPGLSRNRSAQLPFKSLDTSRHSAHIRSVRRASPRQQRRRWTAARTSYPLFSSGPIPTEIARRRGRQTLELCAQAAARRASAPFGACCHGVGGPLYRIQPGLERIHAVDRARIGLQQLHGAPACVEGRPAR